MSKLLERAQDIDTLLSELPLLLDPKLCLSILVTVDKVTLKRRGKGCAWVRVWTGTGERR